MYQTPLYCDPWSTVGRVVTVAARFAVAWYFSAISSYFWFAVLSALTNSESYLIHSARPSGVLSRKFGSATTGMPISLILSILLVLSLPLTRLKMNRSGRSAASFSVLISVALSPAAKLATLWSLRA